MDARLTAADSININGNNYNKTLTQISLNVGSVTIPDFANYVKGITYTQTQQKEFDYTIGTLRPSHIGFGKIESNGTLTLTDAGLAKLNDFAIKDILVPNYLFLGQNGLPVTIIVKYVNYDMTEKTDVLEHIHFTDYSNGVNTDDITYSREVGMLIGKINIGTAQAAI